MSSEYITCTQCGFPILAQVRCPSCGNLSDIREGSMITSKAGIAEDEGVLIPSWFVWLTVGLAGGVILGPSLMATTATGSAKLAEISKQYIERKR